MKKEKNNKTKKNKTLIISIVGGIILLTAIVILIISIISKNNKETKEVDLAQAFNNLVGAESLSVKIEEYEQEFNGKDYYLDDTTSIDIHFLENYEYIETTTFDDKYYNYKGKQIFSTTTDEDKLVWYYKRDNVISSNEEYYKKYLLDIMAMLSEVEYQKENNLYIGTNVNEDINELIYERFNLGEGSWLFGEDIGNVDYTFIVDNIELELEKENIKVITLNFVSSCKKDYPDYCDENKKLVFTFSNINKIDTTLPEEVQKSLEETNAEKWVGTYSYEIPCLNCNEPRNIKNSLILTNEFRFVEGKGWEVKYSLYDGEYINSGTNYYYIENNNIYIVNIFDEIQYKGYIYEDKIELLDENGNVKETFIKE